MYSTYTVFVWRSCTFVRQVSTGILSPFPTPGGNSSIAQTLEQGMHWNIQNNVWNVDYPQVHRQTTLAAAVRAWHTDRYLDGDSVVDRVYSAIERQAGRQAGRYVDTHRRRLALCRVLPPNRSLAHPPPSRPLQSGTRSRASTATAAVARRTARSAGMRLSDSGWSSDAATAAAASGYRGQLALYLFIRRL
jgi:hypothetical protein